MDRTETFQVRVTKPEKQAVLEAANREFLPVSSWLRRVILMATANKPKTEVRK